MHPDSKRIVADRGHILTDDNIRRINKPRGQLQVQVSGLCRAQHREQHARLVRARASANAIDVQAAKLQGNR